MQIFHFEDLEARFLHDAESPEIYFFAILIVYYTDNNIQKTASKNLLIRKSYVYLKMIGKFGQKNLGKTGVRTRDL